MASLEDLALDLASSYAHRRETLLRQQDAAVRAAEEKARPVKREKRLAAISASFFSGTTGTIEARIGPKYQIEVPPASRWRPLAAFDGDDEHEQPTLVATDDIAAALEAAEAQRAAASGAVGHGGRTQEEEEFVDDLSLIHI